MTEEPNPPVVPGEDNDEEAVVGSDEERDVAEHERRIDEMSEESFPTSDPPSTWAGTDKPHD